MATKSKSKTLKWNSVRRIVWTEELYADVLAYLEDGTLPKKVEKAEYQMKWRWKQKYNFFSIEKGEIYLITDVLPKWASSTDGQPLFDMKLPMKLKVVKESEKKAILEKFWSDPRINAYRGVQTFYDKLSQEFLGIQREEVRKFIQNQPVHQLTQNTEQKITTPFRSVKPNEMWFMDLIDMSQYEHQNNGIHFCLNVIDHFSKFAWSRPIKNKSAPVVMAELQQIMYSAGHPDIMISDNGPEFTSIDMSALMERFGIEQRHSMPYTPQTSGVIERWNATLKKGLHAWMTEHNSKRWVDALQALVYNYNTTKQSTTKFTPFQLMFKRDEKVSMLDTLAAKNISDKADKMIKESIQRYANTSSPIQEGDHVRIARDALKEERQKFTSKVTKRPVVQWSKEIYEVYEINDDKNELNTRYSVVDEDGDELQERGKVRWFFRHQLQLVDVENLGELKSVKKKDKNLNFGVDYDPEAHLAELHSKARKAAEIPQHELDEKHNKVEEKAIEKEKKKINVVPVRVSKRSNRGVSHKAGAYKE